MTQFIPYVFINQAVPQTIIQTSYQDIQTIIPDPPVISINLPLEEYKIKRQHLIPFNVHESNNSRFTTIIDAMRYIQHHCQKYHGKFNRSLAYAYLKKCSIYDPYVDQYVYCETLSKREIESAFSQIKHGSNS